MTWLVVTAAVGAVLLLDPGWAGQRVGRVSPGWAGGPGATVVRSATGWARWGGLGRRRRRREQTASAERALEACNVLAEELRAGRDAGSALASAAEVCPELGPVVQAHGLGADVPTTLRRTGVAALARLAGAWQVSSHSGHGLAETVRAVAEDLRADRATRRVVTSELASARATARLLVGLPLAALLVGSTGGARPWLFFVDSVAGAACGVLGLVLLLAGLVWMERIADAVQQQA